jgi:hypothetical protein
VAEIGNMRKIFISYAREDYKIAKRLYDYLLLQGQEPWLDTECILPGQNWKSAIRKAIGDSNFFLALLSPNSIAKRGYVQKELRIGLEILDQVPDSLIFLIPIKVGECEPTNERLSELQWVDLYSDWEGGIRRLNKLFEPKDDEVVDDQSGTKWAVTETIPDDYWRHLKIKPDPSWQFLLREDGAVEYENSGEYFDEGWWSQDGNVVFMSLGHPKWAIYQGRVKGNRIIEGITMNAADMEWTWEASRVE